MQRMEYKSNYASHYSMLFKNKIQYAKNYFALSLD